MGYDARWDAEKPLFWIRRVGVYVGKAQKVDRRDVELKSGEKVTVWDVEFRVSDYVVRGSFWDRDRSVFWTVNLFRCAGLSKADVSGDTGGAWRKLLSRGGEVAFRTRPQKGGNPDFVEVDPTSIIPVAEVDMKAVGASYDLLLGATAAGADLGEGDDCPF